MRFNAAKCNIMQMSRTRDPILFNYSLTGQVLEEVLDAKYLGVTLGNNLEWSKHIVTMTNKANSKPSFLRRNLKGCPEKLKQTAYFSLIRSFMEYGATAWDPYQKYNSDKIDRVQRRTARFVKSMYSRYSSVSDMLDVLGWPPLSQRRQEARLILFFYKIINGLAQVPFEGVLVEAYKGTRRKHNIKFRQIGHTTSQYGQSFFPKTISAWNGLAFAEAPSLAVFNLTCRTEQRAIFRSRLFVRPYIQIRHKDQAACPHCDEHVYIYTVHYIAVCPASRVHRNKLLVDVPTNMYNAASTPLTLEILRRPGARRQKELIQLINIFPPAS